MDDECFVYTIENSKNLNILNLNSCSGLNLSSDLCFSKMSKQNKNLIKLFMDSCNNLTDLSLNMVSNIFLNLQELSIQNNDRITDQGLIDFANNCSTLLKLNIKDCSKITDIGIIEITKVLKHLNSFHFGSSCSDSITDESLIAISKNCLNLKVLGMFECTDITDIGFNSLLTTTLKNLTEIYFECCDNLKDLNVIKMSKYFSNLQVFSIVYYNFFYINDVYYGNDEVDENSENITDESIIAITKNCKNLTELCLKNYESITNIGFESIAKYCLKLKYLTITYNDDTNLEVYLTKIIKKCLKLKELNISSYYPLTNLNVENLKKQNLFLKITKFC
jgi:hypothetical protein